MEAALVVVLLQVKEAEGLPLVSNDFHSFLHPVSSQKSLLDYDVDVLLVHDCGEEGIEPVILGAAVNAFLLTEIALNLLPDLVDSDILANAYLKLCWVLYDRAWQVLDGEALVLLTRYREAEYIERIKGNRHSIALSALYS